MNIRIRRLLIDPIKSHYDKIVVVLALALLVMTALTLYVKIAAKGEELKKDRAMIENLRPLKPDVPAVAKNPFAKDREDLAKPKRLAPSGSNDTLFVPEERVSCRSDKCRKPILFTAKKCPYCGWEPDRGLTTDVPGATNTAGVVVSRRPKDSDGDGIPDWWEVKYGQNSQDATDASTDPDDDGYTNLEEHKVGEDLKYQFNPTNTASVPPAWSAGKLEVTDAKALEFKLRYMSSMRPDGSNWLHIINEIGGQTHSKRIGELVNGFKVLKHEEKFVMVVAEGSTAKMRKDVSELTLESPSGVKVVLVKGEPKLQWERSADVYYVPTKKTIAVKEGEEFQIGAYKYRVKGIDANARKVLISDPAFPREQGKEREIWLTPGASEVVEPAVVPAPKAQDKPAGAGIQTKPVGKADRPVIEPFEKK